MSRAFIQKIGYFTPTQISGCKLWIDALDSNSITLSGSSVVTVLDKSGNGNTLSGGNGWTYNVTKFNTIYPSFYSATVGNMLGQNDSFSIVSTNITVFIVASTVDNGGQPYLVDGGSSGNNRFYSYIDVAPPSPNYNNIVHGNSVSGALYPFTASLVFQPFIFSQSTGTSPQTGSFNGTTFNASGGNTGTITWNGITVGARFSNNGGLVGHICELIIYSNALSSNQRQSVEGYLAQKWGLVSSLPAGHPGRGQTFYLAKNPGIAAVPSNILTDVPYGNFFPLSLPACGLWLDAADASTITYSSGSNLSQWRDKSGNGYIMSNNTGTTTVAANSLNSYNAIYTPSGTSAKIASFTGRTKFTLFFVGKCAAGKYLLGFNSGFVYAGNDTLMSFTVSGNTFDCVDSIGLTNSVVSNNTWFIFCIGYDNVAAFTPNPYNINGSPFNGTNRTTITSPYITPSIVTDQYVSSPFYINSLGTNSYDSDFTAEIIYYNTTLSVNQRQQVEGYLAWKWGLQSTNLPSQHPYYSAAPLSFNRPSQVAGIPIQIRMIPDPWTPLRPLSSGVLPWHWFRGDVGMTTTAWTNFGTSKSNASNVGTITLGNYTQGGSQAGGTNNTCIVSPSGYWRWPGVYQTSYHAIFGVFKLSTSLTNGQTWTWKGNSTAGRGYTPQYRITNTSGVFSDDILSQGAFLPLNGVTIDPSTQFYTHSLVWGSSPAVSLLQVGTKIASPNGWTTDYGLGIYDNEYIGFAVAPAQPAGVTMTLCEILLYATNLGYGGPVDLTAMDISNVQAYLARKWGV